MLQHLLPEIFNGNVKTSIIGSLPFDTPEMAVSIQLSAQIDYITDGQPYRRKYGDINLAFLSKVDGSSPIQGIRIEYGAMRVRQVSIYSELETPTDPIEAEVVRSYLMGVKELEESQGIKYVHCLPLMIMNRINYFGPYEGNKSSLLEDLWEKLLKPYAEFIIKEKKPDMVQGDEPCLYLDDLKMLGEEVLEKELHLIDKIGYFYEKEGIPFMLYLWRPLSHMDPRILEKILSLEHVHILGVDYWANQKEIDKLKKWIKRDKYLSLGLISTRERVESIDECKEMIKKVIREFGKDKIMITPVGGFVGLSPYSAQLKLKNMVEGKNKALSELK